MTVRELYDYATIHSLLDKQVNEVIAIFDVNNVKKETSSVIPNKLKDDILSKVEWSTEDVLWLFST